jgi:hypothetical protein
VAWITLPLTVATAAVAGFSKPRGFAATSTTPADVGIGAAVAGFDAAIRKSPAATDRPRPNANFFNFDSLFWRPTVTGRSVAPHYSSTELVVRLARSRAHWRWLTRSSLKLQLGDRPGLSNPTGGESSLLRVNLRNFMVNYQLAGRILRLVRRIHAFRRLAGRDRTCAHGVLADEVGTLQLQLG